jgi:hypothetical protein
MITTMLRSVSRALTLSALVCLPTIASAQLTVFTNQGGFLAATSMASTDSFNDLIVGSTPASLTRTVGPWSYSVAANTTELFVAGTTADPWLSTNTSTDRLTFSGFNSSMRGIGGSFFGSNDAGAFQSGIALRVTARTVAGSVSEQLLQNTTVGNFLGFVSTSALQSLTVEAIQPTTTTLAWPTVNNLVLAAAPVVVIPEPSSIAMLLTGLVGVLALLSQTSGPRRG